jgi:hypothetical protein
MSDLKRPPAKREPLATETDRYPAAPASSTVTEAAGKPAGLEPKRVMTTALGTPRVAQSRDPAERSSAAEPSDEPNQTGEVDLFKVRRVTIPPDMRAKMLDWWAHERHKSVPVDTMPPDRVTAPVQKDDEPRFIVDEGYAPGTLSDVEQAPQVPNSVTPLGLPSVPMRSTRGIAAAAIFVLTMFVLVVMVMRWGRRSPDQQLTEVPTSPATPALPVEAASPRATGQSADTPSSAQSSATANGSHAAIAPLPQPTLGRSASGANEPPSTMKPRTPASPKRFRPAPEQRPPSSGEPAKARSGPDTESPPFSD